MGGRVHHLGALLGLSAGPDVAVELYDAGSTGLWHGSRNREKSAIQGRSILPVWGTQGGVIMSL